LALVQASLDDCPLGIDVGEANKVTVGDASLACATAIAERFVGCEDAPAFCGGTNGPISRSGIAACMEAGTSVVFDGMLEFGAELTVPAEGTGEKTNRPSFIVVYNVF
jgi:hypothetical protein